MHIMTVTVMVMHYYDDHSWPYSVLYSSSIVCQVLNIHKSLLHQPLPMTFCKTKKVIRMRNVASKNIPGSFSISFE